MWRVLFAPRKEKRSLPARRICVRLAGLLNIDEIALECKERKKDRGKFRQRSLLKMKELRFPQLLTLPSSGKTEMRVVEFIPPFTILHIFLIMQAVFEIIPAKILSFLVRR